MVCPRQVISYTHISKSVKGSNSHRCYSSSSLIMQNITTNKIKYPSILNIHFGMLTWCYFNIAGIKLKVDQFCNDVYNLYLSDNYHKQAPADRK